MLESILGVNEQPNVITLGTAVTYMVAAIVLGLLLGVVYVLITERTKRSIGFIVSLLMLPAVVAVVIVLVGSNVARAFSIAGVFSLVRFRSAPGEGKDISLVFMAMASGLACGLGYISLAFAVTIVLGVIVVVCFKVLANFFKDESKQLRVLIPEDMDYNGAFDDLFAQYTSKANLEKVKTTNMGTLFELTYQVEMKADVNEKKFIDDLRCRNGNLTITLCKKEKNSEKL